MGFLKKGLARFRRKHFNVEDWCGWNQVKSNSGFIKSSFSSLNFKPKNEQIPDDFACWMKQQGLSKQSLPAYIKKARRLIWAYLLIGFLSLSYNIYIIHLSKLLAIYLLFITTLVFAYALRQWKQWVLVASRRTRCSFKFMFQFTLGGVVG